MLKNEENQMSMVEWEVYINNKLVDTVFFVEGCDTLYVRGSLISHDGYPSNTVVIRKNDENHQ